jgi:hypothetical protein
MKNQHVMIQKPKHIFIMTTISLNKRYGRKRILVFDVETTGLPPPKSAVNPPLSAYPHILQLSFVIFDTAFWKVVKSCDFYIKVDESIAIDPFITKLTGITREMCNDRGVLIEDALYEFYQEYMVCDCVVAHNIDFDKLMVCTEINRLIENQGLALLNRFPYMNLVFDPIFIKMHQTEHFCTMRVGRKLCNIQAQNSRGTYIKNPKLVELYQHLFGKTPINLHNSLMDTYVCLRCFVKLRFKFDLRLPVLEEIQNSRDDEKSLHL